MVDAYAAIVGPAHARAATADDAVAGVAARVVVAPADGAEAAEVLARAGTDGHAVVVRGGGTKLAWGRPPARCDVVLSTARIAGVVSHDAGDLVCTVRAGTRLADLRAAVAGDAAHRQALMLDPRHGAEATVGGVLATGASGPLRTRYGTPRDVVLGVRFALADGTRAKAGGRVVKNVAGYDLGKLLVGSLGTLALLEEVVLKLHPAPTATRAVAVHGDVDALAAAAARLATLPVVPTWAELLLPAGALVVRVDSSEDGAAGQVATLVAALGARELPLAEATALVDAAAANAVRTPSVAVAAPPGRLGALLAALAAAGLPAALRALLAAGDAALPDDDPARVARLREALASLGGQLVVRGAEARLAASVAPAGDPVADALAAAVRAQLDPAGTLAPGRVAG